MRVTTKYRYLLPFMNLVKRPIKLFITRQIFLYLPYYMEKGIQSIILIETFLQPPTLIQWTSGQPNESIWIHLNRFNELTESL